MSYVVPVVWIKVLHSHFPLFTCVLLCNRDFIFDTLMTTVLKKNNKLFDKVLMFNCVCVTASFVSAYGRPYLCNIEHECDVVFVR